MDHYLTLRGERLYKQLLTNVSEGLTFSEDVLWEMGPDGIPYSKADFSRLFCASGPLAPSTHSKSRKQAKTKPLPWHAHPKIPRDFMMSYPPALTSLQLAHHHSVTSKSLCMIPVCGTSKSGKITGIKEVLNLHSSIKDTTTEEQMDKTMAQWIVDQQMTRQCQYRTELKSLRKNQYGAAKATSLINDENICSKKYSDFNNASKSSPKPRALQSSQMETLQPVYDRDQDYTVSFFDEQDEQSGKNQTAKNLKHTEPSKRPYPQSRMRQHAANYVNETDNSDLDPNAARMGQLKTEKQEWVYLPIKADVTELGLRPPHCSGQETEVPKQTTLYMPMLDLSALRYAVEEWRNAYKIKTSWQSVTVEGLKKALANQHYQVQMAAIAACASIAVNRPQADPDSGEKVQFGRNCKVDPVLQELLPSLLSALNDPEKEVQMAAAVCQYAMGTPNDRARHILQNALHEDSVGTGADSWVAAQCLVMEGKVDHDVLERLLCQHLVSKSLSDQEQAAGLLANISTKTTLVRSLLAEKLNCANWRNRVLACHIISQLKCPITKDLTSKLLHLMWNDCRGLVRQAAAQALEKLGMRNHIHNDLRNKLDKGSVHQRVEALVLIGQKRIMTAKLLLSFMHCFDDVLMVIRKQACFTAASLMMKDEKDHIEPHSIMNQLIRLMQNDSSCNVKVAAINALGKIGCVTPTLQELLLWALRYEEEPNTRIAACEALRSLAIKGPKLQNHLQEFFILEPDPQVQRHIKGLIKSYNYNLEENKGLVHSITEQVRDLCSKSIITQKVLLLEEIEQQIKVQRKQRQTGTFVMAGVLQKKCKEFKQSSMNSVSGLPDGPNSQK